MKLKKKIVGFIVAFKDYSPCNILPSQFTVCSPCAISAHFVRSLCIHLRFLPLSVRTQRSQSSSRAFAKRSCCVHRSLSVQCSIFVQSVFVHFHSKLQNERICLCKSQQNGKKCLRKGRRNLISHFKTLVKSEFISVQFNVHIIEQVRLLLFLLLQESISLFLFFTTFLSKKVILIAFEIKRIATVVS